MVTIKSVIKFLSSGVFSILGASFSIALIFFISFNSFGLLFGFEKPSPACNNFVNKTQTNFDYYFFPIASYACRPNGGLLQPFAKDVFNWFGSEHK